MVDNKFTPQCFERRKRLGGAYNANKKTGFWNADCCVLAGCGQTWVLWNAFEGDFENPFIFLSHFEDKWWRVFSLVDTVIYDTSIIPHSFLTVTFQLWIMYSLVSDLLCSLRTRDPSPPRSFLNLTWDLGIFKAPKEVLIVTELFMYECIYWANPLWQPQNLPTQIRMFLEN